jgi:hypothetical protein
MRAARDVLPRITGGAWCSGIRSTVSKESVMSKIKNHKSLQLKSETLRTLSNDVLDQVAGGAGQERPVSGALAITVTLPCPTLFCTTRR